MTSASAIEQFDAQRRRLFGIAYRMLGTVADAEDIVQDTWLRWQRTDHSTVVDPAAWLATIATRLAVNAATSARARREVYTGPWLPEPVSTAEDPALGAVNAVAVDTAMLLLLEHLTPPQRAAYVLREAFEYPYRDIAAILECGEAQARQLVKRARNHLAGTPRETADPAVHRELVESFLDAARGGDLERLKRLLAGDAVVLNDGGGNVRSARKPVHGADRAARFLSGILARRNDSLDIVAVDVNGRPGCLLYHGKRRFGLLQIDVADERVTGVYLVINPEKLAGWPPHAPVS